MTQKRVKASDVIGNSYYIYTLQSSNNTPSLNSTINITCNVTDVYGQAISGKSITLYQNNTSKGAKTTDSSGNASWNSISMSSAGLQVFKVENSKIEVFVDNKSDVGHTHSQYLTEHQSLSNYVTTDDSRLSDSRTPTSHTHGNLQNNGQVGSTAQANKNVVTNSSGLITTEDKPTIPSASTNTPSADTTSGSYGSGTTYARANHIHPKSSIYAEATHTHSQYLTEHQSLSNYVTTDDSRLSDSRTPTSHTHGNLQNNGQVGSTAQANKNVVTNSSGLITTEDKPTIPSASSTTPSADTQNGAVGTGTTWARSNHSHPKSSLYAESSHSHTKSQITDFPTIPSKTSDLTNDSGFLTSHQDISGKLDKAQTSYKGKNVVVDSSSGNITFEEKNNHTHSNYLTSTDISGKIDTAGTGLSKSGTTLNHSNSVTALTTASLKKVKYDAQGHITGTSDVSASDLPTHTHSQYLTEHQSLSNYYNKSETNNYDVDFILGTQTTSTSAWTGTTDVISSLREGTTIFYKLPYASTSTSVTLNLTLKGGGTTGAKDVFYKNTTRLTTHFGVGQVVGLTYDGTAWYVISPSDNNSNNDNNYGGIQFKAGEALATQTICCAKVDGMYYKVANGVVLDIRYPLIMTSSAVTSGTTTNTMYRTWYAVNIANTKSMTLTNGSQLFLEGTAYSDGKFTISSNVVTHTLTNGRYYIKVGTALSTTQIRFISDMTVYYYNGTTLKPVIKKEQIVDFPTIPSKTSDLTNDSGFLTSHQSLSGYLQTSDVKDNLTSTDTNKPLSANQGKALNTNKENISNKVTSISSSSTNTQYPSAKCVYDENNDLWNYVESLDYTQIGGELTVVDEGIQAIGLEQIINQIISRLTAKSNTNHTHSGYASSSHTHGTWSSTSITNGTLYYNSAIRLCSLRYSRTFSSASQNTLYEWGQLIPSTYRPKYMVSGSGNRNGATIIIDSDGYVYGRFAIAFSSSTDFYYHIMWHY